MTTTRAIACCRAQMLPRFALQSAKVNSSAISTAFFPRELVPSKFSKRMIANGARRQARQMPALPFAARASSSSPQVSSDVADTNVDPKKLAGINVYSPDGTEVPLLSLWESRPAVVAFTRHFGCLLCKKRMDILESRKAEMDAAGVALITITPGNTEQARKYLANHKFSGEIYVDPSQESHGALEFVKGLSTTFNPTAIGKSREASDEGYKVDWSLFFNYAETMRRGAWQQGGVLVAGPGGETVKYVFKDKYSGDELPLDEVMSACCA